MIENYGKKTPNLKDLVLLKFTKWYKLGLQLNISEHELETIKENNPKDNDSCKREMFKKWLEETPHASYSELKDALVKIGEKSVAAGLMQHSGRQQKG